MKEKKNKQKGVNKTLATKKSKRILTTFLAMTMTGLLLFSGCTSEKEVSKEKFDFEGYPINTSEKLTYFMSTNTNLTSMYANFGETEFAKELHKRTGVDVEYIHPAAGQETQMLALYVASDEVPDMVEYGWIDYSGGADKAIEENVIISLNDYMDEAPNFKAYLESEPSIDQRIKTDKNNYYVFPFIRGDERLLVSTGPIIRRDWLNELGLSMPETVEDLENILRKFKNEKKAKAPMSIVGLDKYISMVGGYQNFYVDNGNVKYGVLDDSYKLAVQTLSKWYKEGLIDENFISLDSKTLESNMLNGETGVTFGAGGGNLGKWLEEAEGVIPNFDITGFNLPYADIIGNVNDAYAGFGSVAISGSCKNPGLAVRFLDYGYSEEGKMLYNFGIEGVSYNNNDGNPLYSEAITNNPDGLSMAQALLKYCRASSSGPFVQDVRYIDQYYTRSQQKEALDAWSLNMEKEQKKAYPKATLTAEENDEFSTIMAEVKPYVNEMTSQFIIGTASLDEYDNFIENLKKYKINRAIELKQSALERFNRR